MFLGETSATIEYRQRVDKYLARTICAFLNTLGGTIIIGCDKSGKAIGLIDSVKDEKEIHHLINRRFKKYKEHVLISLVKEGMYDIIIINVRRIDYSSNEVGFLHKYHSIDKKYYLRRGKKTASFNPKLEEMEKKGIFTSEKVRSGYKKLGKYINGKYFYRYMGMKDAILCLEKSNIRFAEPCTWEDKFESRFYMAKIGGTKCSNKNPVVFACCLTNKRDNEAAWKIYTDKAVGLNSYCVQFKINREAFREQLCSAIGAKYTLYEGAVYYRDEETIRNLHLRRTNQGGTFVCNTLARNYFDKFNLDSYLNLLILKRNAFMHEREVRFFLIPKNKEVRLSKKGEIKEVFLSINWSKIIEEVLVVEKCTETELNILRETLLKYGNGGKEIKNTRLIRKIRPQKYSVYGRKDDNKTINIKL